MNWRLYREITCICSKVSALNNAFDNSISKRLVPVTCSFVIAFIQVRAWRRHSKLLENFLFSSLFPYFSFLHILTRDSISGEYLTINSILTRVRFLNASFGIALVFASTLKIKDRVRSIKITSKI